MGAYPTDAIASLSGRDAPPRRRGRGGERFYLGGVLTLVATQRLKRPRGFDRKTKKGTSDHLPVTAVVNH